MCSSPEAERQYRQDHEGDTGEGFTSLSHVVREALNGSSSSEILPDLHHRLREVSAMHIQIAPFKMNPVKCVTYTGLPPHGTPKDGPNISKRDLDALARAGKVWLIICVEVICCTCFYSCPIL